MILLIDISWLQVGAQTIPDSARPQTWCCMSCSISKLPFLPCAPALAQGPRAGFGPGSVCREPEGAEAVGAAPPAQDSRQQGGAAMEHTQFNWSAHCCGTGLNSRAPRPLLCSSTVEGALAAAPIPAGSRVRLGSICTITLLIIQTLFCVCRYRSLLARWKILRKKHCN